LLNYQNNYAERSNQLLEYQNFVAGLLIIFKVPTKLFWWFNKIIFRSIKIL